MALKILNKKWPASTRVRLSTRGWHSLEANEVLEFVESSHDGLTESEAETRLKQFGPNELPREKSLSKLRLFLNQFNNPLMFVMLITVTISMILKHYTDTLIMILVIMSNVIVAFYQENKAGNAIQSLKKMVKINARIKRGKDEKQIDSEGLVIGDVIILQAGDKVPADARILESRTLKVNEASLTGESVAVDKLPHKLPPKTGISDQKNMLFMGTTVEEGYGRAVIVATGIQTQMGEIVHLLAITQEELTPLQKELLRLAKLAAGFVSFVIFLIFIIGLLRGQSMSDILLASLSLAVSAIPAELLPAITIILVLAMRRILKKQGLVRKLVSNETLGSVTVICTDKTGTLTEGKMEVTHLVTKAKELTGKKLHTFTIDNPDPQLENLKQLVKISLLNNDAFLENPADKPDHWIMHGKITEQALLRLSLRMGFNKQNLEQEHLLIDKIYFTSELKYSATLRETDGEEATLFVIGAPEVVFSKSSDSKGFQTKIEGLTKQGLRVLAVAYKNFDLRPKYKKLHDLVSDLQLVGLIALEDPIREDVPEAIKLTKRAGIRTVVVTGDHKLTASVIAKQIGLDVKDDQILEGQELEAMSDAELHVRVGRIAVFARVSPKHKLRIVDALQAQGEVVAMVGDGVNDAPALKTSDIGVAVNSGTDVTKEVADLVLLDNGFGTIIKAIEQGRIIFSNIRKVFIYLLVDDFSEIYIFLAAMILGMPLPLLPAQILWINLVEAGLPDLSLTTEQESDHVMDQKPRPKKEPVMSRPLKFWFSSAFLLSGTIALILFATVMHITDDVQKARTMTFAFMALDSLFFAFSVRSFRQSIFRLNIFNNKILTTAVLISFTLLLTSIYTPGLQKLLSTIPLGMQEWILIVSLVVFEILMIEMSKAHFLYKKNRAVVL
jgi:P-type Ca2+ transporter type 2C